MTSPEEHRRLQLLVEAAFAQPADARTTYLARQCAGDTTLFDEAKELLSLYTDDEPPPEAQRIGPYRLVSELGAGGMGVVYLAEREDSFHRKVALKVIRRGMDTDYFLSRFHQEREILGALDHPGIVRIVDAGSTDDGRPFLVMDFVDGIRVDRYCQQAEPGVAERIRIFLGVCEAVEHAHRNLIVHRDLKPGNILVTPSGQAKLLDFGIAKVVDNEGPEEKSVTIPIMTRQYASPEQIRGARVTTSSDLYTLGLILYELLAECRPYELKERPVTEVERIVCQDEPPPPSSVAPKKVAGALRGDLDRIILMALRKEPERRYPSVEAFAADLTRYLAGRPVKAQKDTLRYRASKYLVRNRTAVAASVLLAAVIGAGAGSTVWQARIANQERQRAEREAAEARKQQAAASEQARIAVTERDRAEAERQRAESEKQRAEREIEEARRQRALAEARLGDLRSLSNSMLFEIHEAIRDLPGATEARTLLISKARTHLEKLSAESKGDPQTIAGVAEAYSQLARLQGGNADSTTGDTSAALENQGRALAMRQKLAVKYSGNAAYQRDLAESYLSISEILGARKQPASQERNAALALETYRRVLSINPSDRAALEGVAASHRAIGAAKESLGKMKDAAAAYRDQSEARRQLAGLLPGDAGARMELAEARDQEARVLEIEGRFSEAAAIVRESVSIYEQTIAQKPNFLPARTNLTRAYRALARLEDRTGNLRAARDGYRKALGILDELSAQDPKNARLREDALVVESSLSMAYFRSGDVAQAISGFEKGIERGEEILKRDPQNRSVKASLAGVHQNLGQVLLEQQRYAEAARHFEKSLSAAGQGSAGDVSGQLSASLARIGLGRIARDQNRLEEAEAHFSAAVRTLEKLIPGSRDHRVLLNLAIAYSRMGDVSRLRGKPVAALNFYSRALPITDELIAVDSRNAVAMSARAECLSRIALVEEGRGNFGVALKHYRDALGVDEQLAQRDPTDLHQRTNLAQSRYRVCEMQLRMSRAQEAAESCRMAVAAWEPVASGASATGLARRDYATGLEKLGEANLLLAADTAQSSVNRSEARERACRAFDRSLGVWAEIAGGETESAQRVRDRLEACRKMAKAR